MSASITHKGDLSNQSALTHPDLSLPSLSSFSTPARNTRLPSSTATSSAALATPSPPNAALFSKRRFEEQTPALKRFGLDDAFDDHDVGAGGGGDVLDTPGAISSGGGAKKWSSEALETPGRMKRTRSAGSKGGVNLTLRDQEKHIDALKKENFNIKLKVHFLEERLAQLAPDQIDAALKQNINLKIEVQQRGMELKKLRKLVFELESALEKMQKSSSSAGGVGGSGSGSGVGLGLGSSAAEARARELEEKLEEREREVRDLRKRLMDVRNGGHNDNDNVIREYEARNAELEEELDNVRGLLEENMEEMERLRELVEHRDDEGDANGAGSSRLRKHIGDLERENDELRVRIDEQEEIIAIRNDEKEDLADMVETLKLEIEDVQRRREAESIERSQSRAQIIEEREEREAVEDDLNAVRDKLAAAQIELQQKEDDLEMKEREIQDLISEHDRIVEHVENEWRGEAEEARGQVDELRDVLEQREAESKDLRMHIAELESNTDDLHEKFEVALAHLERESEEKDAEIEAANREIEKLGVQVYHLEEENERIREEAQRIREDDSVERERLEALTNALKDKLAGVKAQLTEQTQLNESRAQELAAYQSDQDTLSQHIEKLVSEIQRERTTSSSLQSSLSTLQSQTDDLVRKHKRDLEAKESALQSALNDLARTQAVLTQREGDLNHVEQSLQVLERESRKLGESHTTAKFSLELEVDRLKRDIERLEDELARARKELTEREGKNRDRDTVIDKLHAENRELASQLAVQTQARLNVAEKLDDAQASLRAVEGELGVMKGKVGELEGRLAKDQRALLSAEAQYRDQLTERNTLLLTIYQYMDKILGVDKTPKKHGQAETKPFTNFSVFHDNLITRLKALSQIQLDFDKRCKEAEARYGEKLNEMRKQLESRWKQIDKFESSVKVLAEAKAGWKKRLGAKEGEVEALKQTNSELQAIISSNRKPGSADSMEVRALTARAINAERRSTNLQNQLLASEEKVTAMNQKTSVADHKWEVRVKEYESRLKVAEEKVKRERQGGKERALELESQAKSYQRQIELAQKRIQQLNDIIDNAGLSARKTSPPGRRES